MASTSNTHPHFFNPAESTSNTQLNKTFVNYALTLHGNKKTTKGTELYKSKYSQPYSKLNSYEHITFQRDKISEKHSELVILAERLVKDAASGGFMYAFNDDGNITTGGTKTRISISPQERFLPGWFFDVNQILVSSIQNSVIPLDFAKIVWNQVIVDSPDDYDESDKVGVLAAWRADYFDNLDDWISTAQLTGDQLPDIFDNFIEIENENNLSLSATEEEFIRILVYRWDNIIPVAKKVARSILFFENKYALVRHSEATSKLKNVGVIAQRIVAAFTQSLPSNLGSEDETDVKNIIKEVVTYLIINHITIKRYLNKYCMKNDAISNKVLNFLETYWIEGKDTALKSILNREQELMALTDTQLRQLISAFRRLELDIISDQTKIHSVLYNSPSVLLSSWLTEGDGTKMKLNFAGVVFRNAMNHVIRFFLAPTPYSLNKWRQEELVLGGPKNYRSKLHALIKTLYSSTSPYAFDKMQQFLLELRPTNSIISTQLSVSQDSTISSENFQNNTAPYTSNKSSLSNVHVDSDTHNSDEFINITESQETMDECLSIILQLSNEERIKNLGNVSLEDLCDMVKKLYGPKSSQLTPDQFVFVLHHALRRKSEYVSIEDIVSTNDENIESPLKPHFLILTPFQDMHGKFGFIAKKKLKRRTTKTQIYYTGNESLPSQWGGDSFLMNDSKNSPDAEAGPLMHTMYIVLYAQQIVSSADLVSVPTDFDKSLFLHDAEKTFKLARDLILTRIYALDIYAEQFEEKRIKFENVNKRLVGIEKKLLQSLD